MHMLTHHIEDNLDSHSSVISSLCQIIQQRGDLINVVVDQYNSIVRDYNDKLEQVGEKQDKY